MKRIFYILIILLIIPTLVNAKTLDTSFDNEKCVLTVSGSQTGHDATVSLFDNQNKLIGFKTGEINNGNYVVEFVLAYDSERLINITVANEDGQNEISKNDVNIPACEKTVEFDNNKNHKYTVTSEDGNIISFNEEDGHEYELQMFNFMGLSDVALQELEISKEEYEATFAKLIEITKNHGTLLSFYQIEVVDENGHHITEGPFKIKIKITEEMKKYNTFKVIFIDVDNNFKMEDPITFTVNGDYLEGTLNHLSTYALVGSITPEKTNAATGNEDNPKTGDRIVSYISLLGLSIIGLVGAGIYTKKKILK